MPLISKLDSSEDEPDVGSDEDANLDDDGAGQLGSLNGLMNRNSSIVGASSGRAALPCGEETKGPANAGFRNNSILNKSN